MVVNFEGISVVLKKYVEDVRLILPVVKAVLYGSYAKGCARKDSDVDVCFFLTSFDGQSKHDILKKLFLLTHGCGLYLEPNVFEESDLYTDNPFVKEVLRTGIEIF
jgi:predicted nucleotidyltransferase